MKSVRSWFTEEARSRLTFLVFIIGLLAAGAALLHANRNMWFYHDEWDFLVNREAGSITDLMRPHNEHWSLLPILIYRGLFSVFGVSTYWPYFGVLVTLHMVVALAVYGLLRRAAIPAVVAIPSSLVLVVFGNGYQNMLWAFQIGFVGSLALVLCTLWLVGRDAGEARNTDVLAAALLVAAVMTSSLGIACTTGIAIAFGCSRDWRRGAVLTGPALAVYGLWFAWFHGEVAGTALGSVGDSLLKVPEVAGTHLAEGLSSVFGFPSEAGWPLLVVFIVALLIAVSSRNGLGPMGTQPLAALAVILVLVSLGRAADPSVASRYRHVYATLLIPALGGMWRAVPTHRRRAPVVFLLSALMTASVVTNYSVLSEVATNWVPDRSRQKWEVIASLTLIENGVTTVDEGDLLDTGGLRARELARLSEAGRLPHFTLGSFAPDLVTQQTARLQNSFTPFAPAVPRATVEFDGVHDMSLAVVDRRCASFDATGPNPFVRGRLKASGAISIESTLAGEIRVFRGASRPFETISSISTETEPGRQWWLVSVGETSSPLIRFDGPVGAVLTVCAESVAWLPGPE